MPAKLNPPGTQWFPATDTPYATASSDLKNAWNSYGVTLIPGRNVLDVAPSAPKPTQVVAGCPAAKAGLLIEANYRTNAYEGWAEAHAQGGLAAHLHGPDTVFGRIKTDLKNGTPVIEPACALYAYAVSVTPVEDAIRSYFAANKVPSSASIAMVEGYAENGPCTINEAGPNGQQTGIENVEPHYTQIELGRLIRDPVLGDIWYADQTLPCSLSGRPPACDLVK